MLSILIPVYNHSIVNLVKTLRTQCLHAKIPFEIICFDDLSKRKFKQENQVVGALFGVSYLELSENLGRAKIRNWLVKSANYPNLLFMDCDSEVPDKNYIQTYLKHIDKKKKVICGGRIYSDKPTRSKKKRLHWKYGSQREQLDAITRSKSPFLSFHTNNFLINSQVFDLIKFDNEIKGYGYEDLLFAFELKKHNIRIHHIDNPLKHLGIEYTQSFIDKTKEALANLVFLHKRDPKFKIKLIDRYYSLKKYGLLSVFKRYYEYNQAKIETGLFTESPKLRHFDLFRLYHFIYLWEKATKEQN
jgi:GT2 family glycosyltransferase